METRSRKRAEATSHRPSPATPSRSKRARVSANNSNSSASASFAPPRSRPSTRAAPATPVIVPTTSGSAMDSGLDSSASGSKRAHDKGAKKEPEKEEDRLAEKEREKEIKERELEKGKEKEPDKEKDTRSSRDRDRTPAAASGGADDDHDGEGGSSLHQNLASASSALHGLLRKLGAGLDDLLPSSTPSSHQNSRLKRILSGLRAEGEEGRQLDSLSQLCELLSIGTEESLSSFSVDSFVPVLVGLLNYEYNPDMMLLAARALTHLCDVLPSSCAAVVHYGAVPCFCARLLTIEYIDLAEQSLQALEKISHEHPTACLRAGALIAVLSYLDFFSTGVQRVAVSTAANICRQLPSDAADFVSEAVPILTNLLQYQDSKVVEHASVCLTRIAESFASSSEKLDTLCSHGLIPQAARLISVGNSSGSLVPQTSLSTSTYTGLIRLLSTCASGSAAAAESLLLLRISSILKDILAGAGLVSCTSVSPSSVNRPPEQLYEIVTLVNELLPPMPDALAGATGALSSNGVAGGRVSRKYSTVINAAKAELEQRGHESADVGIREKLLHDQPELLVQFGVDLFPVLVQVYGSSVNPPVRHKCLAAINKLLHFSTPEMLRSLLKESNISSFLAGVLASKDASILITALQIAEMLMQKLPDVFSKVFVKEGVVHAIDVLIASESTVASPPQASAAGKSGDASTSAASGPPPPTRPRRVGSGRRRSSGSNNDVPATEEPGGSSATPVGSPPNIGIGPEPAFRTLRSGLRAAAIAVAKRFKEIYFSGDSGLADAGVTESLCKLKTLCAKLNGEGVGEVKAKGKGKAKAVGSSPVTEEQLSALMSEILAELGGEDGVSTFEFVGSGVVGSLLNYFACGTPLKDAVSDTNPARLRQEALQRFKQFIVLSLPSAVGHGKEAPLTMLVRKLQNALASLERFPVVLSHTPRSSSGSASIAAGLSALTQPFKLRLSRASNEKVLRDYASNIVLIEPLATLVAVEDFLWPRVKRHDSVFGSTTVSTSDATTGSPAPTPSTSAPVAVERRPSTRSRSSAAVVSALANKEAEGANITSIKGKGKAVSRAPADSTDEPRGPETRNAAARRRAAAVGAPAAKQALGFSVPCESEDEEVDVSPVEIEEAVAMEEDDLSEEEDDEDEDDHEEDDDLEDGQAEEEVFGEEPAPVCIGERVHDVQLGDSVDGATASTSTPSTEVASQSSGFSAGLAGISVGGKGGGSTGGAETTAGTRTGISLGTKGSLSFAAAAMAGMASASGNVSRSSARATAANSPPKLVFSLAGKILNRSLTIFQAIQRQAVADDDDEERYGGPDYPLGGGRRLWDEVYTISYQRVDCSADQAPGAPSSTNSSSPTTTNACQRVVGNPATSEDSWQQASLLDNILKGELPCDLDKTNTTYDILLLLRILEGLNRLAPRLRTQGVTDAYAEGSVSNVEEWQVAGPLVPVDEFLSSKLTPKLARQMQDALALCSGGLPAWCHQLTRACPFLFPFETRRQYFHSTAFGLTRALQRLQQQQSADGAATSNDRELRVARLQRQKVRVSRNRILDSAAKVMELYSGHKAVLEVEYFGEVGTGLGPTLEFYTLLSHELQRSSLEMWRTEASSRSDAQKDVDMPDADGGSVDDSYSAVGMNNPSTVSACRNEDYVHAPNGLFPRPWPAGSDTSGKYGKVIEHFRLLGRVMAKALQDGRLLDLPLSKGFYKLVLGQDLDCYDIQTIDPELGKTLLEMQLLVRRKQYLELQSGDNRKVVEELSLRGSKIEDLCLDFTLPGQPDYVLKPGGNNLMVDIDSLEEYVSMVVDATVKSGISQQLEAFRAGFNQVFQLSTLQIFNEDELDSLLCGRRELWVSESLADLMKFDHGYTASSPPIRNLIEIMGEFTPDEQRAFLRFVTGAPRLPPGGLAALSPKLTIVRKHPTGVSNTGAAVLGSTPPGAAAGLGTTLADGDLPSVMTCANYLKLPPYSCKEVMRERLVYAIWEGQGSFDLS
ncbi:E3 ubiquitin-protein ligase TRIP12 [Marchantia polymorpha subsp. ruderalis]|uniref:HECT-type E3 ubiquitin transferase n=2 Tax=Marchantia polymorpha TaxID=3197 RepID=A0A176W4J0_MARPO|nr:hypothetical protein AXG93_3911s1340 [Marchantia polymorpha subsp. ruderalis]PTQ36781.1 hypothetical protein MARPO_0061s0046 [Marchantia polymorpha]PTQ36782.1 hypothetical protein MARPO_0061s0046 [Marchantia polymorpha]PTQ36783.1 hypothetical protein MARPO_0061s0046 [Marchantia polymorpha]BBM99900.1 hypothetical protein Mp_1g24750 [Marchantia polymorpha subsp. ruderalis]|eukprot:PTQ36781.1 hypothetical protein MARPO_0061s0046 [Marchantia polymorpha]